MRRGYCTPGRICSALAVLDDAEHGWPSALPDDLAATDITLDDAQIHERMGGNLCRCAAYG